MPELNKKTFMQGAWIQKTFRRAIGRGWPNQLFRIEICFIGALLQFATAPAGANQAELVSSWKYEVRAGVERALSSTQYSTVLYNFHDNSITEVTKTDYDANGQVDEVFTTITQYGKHDNLVSSIETIDFNSDGVVDWIGVTSYTNVSSKQTEIFLTVESPPGSLYYTVKATLLSDDLGRVIEDIEDYSFWPDGETMHFSETWTYDDTNHTSVQFSEGDIDGDGIPDRIIRTTSHLNDRGDPITSLIEVLKDPFEGTAWSKMVTFTYDKYGNLSRWDGDYTLPSGETPIQYHDTFTEFNVHRGQLLSQSKELRSARISKFKVAAHGCAVQTPYSMIQSARAAKQTLTRGHNPTFQQTKDN